MNLLSDYTSYSNLDASTGEYQEEEGFYPEGEEENLENYQGKLILLQSAKPYLGQGTLILIFIHTILFYLYTKQVLLVGFHYVDIKWYSEYNY